MPDIEQCIESFRQLSEALGEYGVVWRFDPLILTDNIGIFELLRKVSDLAEILHKYSDTLVFSFADIAGYRKVGRNLTAHGISYEEWTEANMREFASRLSQLNQECGWNLKLCTCAEKIDLSEFGIEHSRCVDDERIARIAHSDDVLLSELGLQIHEPSFSLFGDHEMLPPDAMRLTESRARSLKFRGRRGGSFRADLSSRGGSDAGIVTDETSENMPKRDGAEVILMSSELFL